MMIYDESTFLNRGLLYLTQTRDLRRAVANLVRTAVEAVGSDSGSLYLLDRTKGTLEPYVLVNFSEEYLKGCTSVPLGTQCCGRAALHKLPWVVEDMLEDPLFADCREAAMASGMRAGFSVPVLLADGECVGTLGAQFHESHRPSASDIELQRMFAQLIAVAIVRDREAASGEMADALQEKKIPQPIRIISESKRGSVEA